MLKWIMNYAIEKFLSDYLVIDKHKTKIEGGTFILEKIKVKQEIFQNLNLPFFEIKNSFIGKISFEFEKIMTTHPEDYPIKIEINEIFVNIAQKGINDWSQEKKLEELKKAKTSILNNMEKFYATYLENKINLENTNRSEFTNKLMDNISLTVENVVIRLEDDISFPSQPYSMALIMKKLKVVPKVEEKKDVLKINKKQENSEFFSIRKHISMDDFSIYMDVFDNDEGNNLVNFITEKGREKAKKIESYLNDNENSLDFYQYCSSEIEDHLQNANSHNFLLYKLDFSLSLIYNPDYQKNFLPYITIDFSIERLNFAFDLNQIKVLLKVSSYITFINNSYYLGIQEKDSQQKMDTKAATTYLEIYVDYFDKKFFYQKPPEELLKKLADQLEVLEYNHKYEYIKKIRYLSYPKLEYYSKLRSYDKKILENSSSFQIFNNKDQNDKKKEFEEKKKSLEEEKDKIFENLEEILEFINDDEKIEKELSHRKSVFLKEEKKLLDKNYIKIKFMIKIKSFKFSLLSRIQKINNYKKDKEKRYNKDYFDSYINFKEAKDAKEAKEAKEEKEEKEAKEEKKISNVNKYFFSKKNKDKNKDYFENIDNTLPENVIDENEENFPEEKKENNFHKEKENEENYKIMEAESNKFSFFEFEFTNFEFFFNMGLEKMDLFIFLGNLNINQYISNHKIFKKILESKLENGENLNIEEKNEEENLNSNSKSFNLIKNMPSKNFIDENILEKIEKKYDEKMGALFVSFQMDPDLPNSQMRLRLRNSKRLYLNLDFFSLYLTSFLMSEVLNSEIDFENISKRVSKESYENMMHGYQLMKNQYVEGDYKPFSMHLDVVLKGPKIILPQDILNQNNKSCLLLSMGVLSVKSQLTNRISDEEINISTLKFYNDLFDMYDINVKGFELNIIYDFGKYLQEIEVDYIMRKTTSFNDFNKTNENANKINYLKSLNIIEKVDFNILLSQLIEPKNIFHERIKIGMQLNQISININEPITEYLANFYYYYNYFNIFYEDELDALRIDKDFMVLASRKNQKEKNETFQSNYNSNELKSRRSKQISIKNKNSIGKKSLQDNKTNEFNSNTDNNKSKKENENNNNNNNEDRMLLDFNLTIGRVNLNMQKIVNKEEKKNLIEFNLPFQTSLIKPFVSLALLNLRLNMRMQDSFSMSVIFVTEDLIIFHNEYYWTKQKDYLIKKYLIKPDFQFILSKNSELFSPIEKNEKNPNIFNKKKNEFEELRNYYLENKKNLVMGDAKENNFFYFKYKFLVEKNLQKIKLIFNQTEFNPNVTSLLTLQKYYYQIMDIYYINSGREVKFITLKMKNYQENVIMKRRVTTNQQDLINFNRNLLEENNNNNNNNNIIDEENKKPSSKNNNFWLRLKRILYKRKIREKNENNQFNGSNYLGENQLIAEEMHNIQLNTGESLSNNQRDFPKTKIKKLFEDYFDIENKLNIYLQNIKSILKVSLKLKKFEMNIPVNPEKEITEIFTLHFNFDLNLVMTQNYEMVYQFKKDFEYLIKEKNLEFSSQKKLDKQIKADVSLLNFFEPKGYFYRKKKLDLFFCMRDFQSDLKNYVGVFLEESKYKKKMIENLRIFGNVKQFLLHELETAVTSVDLRVEPFLLNLGIGDFKVFQKLSNDYYEKYEKIWGPQVVENNSNNKKSNNNTNNINNANNANANSNSSKKNNINSNNYNSNKTKNSAKSSKTNDTQKLNNEKPAIVIIPTNLDEYNYKYNIILNLEKINTEFFDNIAKYTTPLINLNISKLKLQMITNTKNTDKQRYLQILTEIFTEKHLKNSQMKINNLIYYLDTNLLLEINIFHEKFHNWEPLIEPLNLNFNQYQITNYSANNILLKLTDIIDFNLSTNFLLTVDKILKKFKKDLRDNRNKKFDGIIHNNKVSKKKFKKNNSEDEKIRISKNQNHNKEEKYKNFKENLKGNFIKNVIEKQTEKISEISDNYSTENYKKKKGKLIKIVNETGLNIGAIFDDQENHKSFFSSNKKNIIKAFESDIHENYFLNTYSEYEKFHNNNKIWIYFGDLNFFVKGIDIKENKIIIYRLDSKLNKLNDNEENLPGEIKNFPKMNMANKIENYYLEILINIKTRKGMKYIIIESNIRFYNNTNKMLRLAFVKSDLIKNEKLTENVLSDLIENETLFECEKENHLKIPLNLILENYNIFIGCLFKKREKNNKQASTGLFQNLGLNLGNNLEGENTKNNSEFHYNYEEVFKFYCKSLNFIYLLSFEYMNLQISEMEENIKAQKKREICGKYCSRINFESSLFPQEDYINNNIIITSDILLLKSDDDLIPTGENVDLKNPKEIKEAKEKSYCFTIIFNAPVLLSNKTPNNFVVNFLSDNNNNNNLGKFHLNILDAFIFYFFDLFENKITTLFEIKNNENLDQIEFQSKKFKLEIQDDKKIILNLQKLNNPQNINEISSNINSMNLIIETEEFKIKENNFKPIFFSKEIFFTKSRRINFYFEYIIVNRLENILFFPLKKEENFDSKNFNKKNLDFFEIKKNNFGVFSLLEKETFAKIAIKNDEENFSKKFEINYYNSLNTIFNYQKTNKDYSFNVLISSINDFNFSKVIYLDPRFILSNQTCYSFLFKEIYFDGGKTKEINNDNDSDNDYNFIKKNSEVNLLLENCKSLPKEKNKEYRDVNYLQIKIGNFPTENSRKDNNLTEKRNLNDNNYYNENNLVSFESQWSNIFNIDSEIDINITCKVPTKDFEEFILPNIEKENDSIDSDIDNKNDHLGFTNTKINKLNDDFYFIVFRIFCTKRQNGAKFIIISEPKFPNFYIENFLESDISIRQKNTNENFSVEKNSKKIFIMKELYAENSPNKNKIEIFCANKNLNWVEFDLMDILDLYNLEKEEFFEPAKNPKFAEKEKMRKNQKSNLLKKLKNCKNKEAAKNIQIELEKLKTEINNFDNENNDVHIYLDTVNNNETRIIKIIQGTNLTKIQEKKFENIQENNTANKEVKIPNSKIKMKLKGFGVSFININCEEIFYLSLFRLQVNYETYYMTIRDLKIMKSNISMKLNNFQIDYCKEPILSRKKSEKNYENPCRNILVPHNQYILLNETQKKKENFFCFFYLLLQKEDYENIYTGLKNSKISNLKLLIDSFDLNLDQNILNSLLEIYVDLTCELDFYNQELKKEQDFDTQNSNENIQDVLVNKKNKQIEEKLFTKLVAKLDKNFNREKYLELLESYMKLTYEKGETILSELDISYIYYIEKLKIFSNKFFISTKFDITSINLKILPKFVTNFLGYFLNIFSNLENLEIKLNEIKIPDSYNRLNYLIYDIAMKYYHEMWNYLGNVISSTKLIGQIFPKFKNSTNNLKKIFNDEDFVRMKFKVIAKGEKCRKINKEESIKDNSIKYPDSIKKFPAFFRPPRNYLMKDCIRKYDIKQSLCSLVLVDLIKNSTLNNCLDNILFRKTFPLKIRNYEKELTVILSKTVMVIIKDSTEVLLCLKFVDVVESFYDKGKFMLFIKANFDFYLTDENYKKENDLHNANDNDIDSIENSADFYRKNVMCLKSKYYKNLIEIDYVINKMNNKANKKK